MADLRLYAIGIDEMLDLHGADPAERPRLQELAEQNFATAAPVKLPGLLGKVGPLFKRSPEAPVINPTDPTDQDIADFLSGDHMAPDRVPAAWRLLETLVSESSWGSIRLQFGPHEVDEVDFALARGGVAANVGLHHLLTTSTEINLLPVRDLTVGWYDHERALAMAEAYRQGLDQVSSAQQDQVTELIVWLDNFPQWAQNAAAAQRPIPDLIAFWVQ
ncbi:MAG: hypothetical protein L0G99_12570 [Propionibacteriales bacterium]|nr:hypothetical protein [Propionibacteriales bacterium]